MDDMEETILTPEAEADAMDRDDDLGRLVSAAFAFAAQPFPFAQDCMTGGAA